MTKEIDTIHQKLLSEIDSGQVPIRRFYRKSSLVNILDLRKDDIFIVTDDYIRLEHENGNKTFVALSNPYLDKYTDSICIEVSTC